MTASPKVFFAFRDAPERRAALRAAPGAAERYRLFGLDEFVARGAVVRHNLEHETVPGWARAADRALNEALARTGGYGGDFASVLGSLRVANAGDVVFATVDTVGLPLVLLKRARRVRPPLVYTSVGLPERLEQLRGPRMTALYRGALASARALVAYSEFEADRLRNWLGDAAPPVVFVPFGVDTRAFQPKRDVEPDLDVVSVGADPRRDFELLARVASRHASWRFLVVASRDNARRLVHVPENLTVETDLPLGAMRDRLARARVVALPVRDNTYSGATTTLLQAMAMAKPVVVSRTAAIATGYDLHDGVNCRFVTPGDDGGFERALVELLTGADAATFLGIRARRTVERSLSWERYCDALWNVVVSVS